MGRQARMRMLGDPAMDPATIRPAVEGENGDFAAGYRVLRGLIDPALTEYFWSYAHTKFASRLMKSGATAQMPGTPHSYGDAAFDGLMEYVRPRIEAAIGRNLLPTYSFFRIHRNGDELTPHTDRRANEIVVTLNIGQIPAEPWPFCVETGDGAVAVELLPGDAMAYLGHGRRHWRGPFTGERAVQATLSYVDADGPNRHLVFDRRETLMRPFVPFGSARAEE